MRADWNQRPHTTGHPTGRPAARVWTAAVAALFIVGLSGCVERTITITSEPDGALVYLNDREIGRTPVDVEFIHYGTYDVRLVKDGYEPLLTFGKAKPPLWDAPGPDLLAELAPVELRSDIEWHYELQPAQSDPEALVERARTFRSRAVADGAPESGNVPPADDEAAPPDTDGPGS